MSCTVPGTVAITFDDGPFIYTQGMLDLLNAANLTVTFFMNGYNWGCIYDYYQVVRQMDASGHQIASHTYSHPDLATMTQASIAYQMNQNDATFLNIIGKTPTFMRPPFGSYNPTVQSVLASLGYVITMWSLDSGDSVGATIAQQQANYNNAPNGGSMANILNHDVQVLTAQTLLPWVINWYKASGLRSVTVAECLGVPLSLAYRAYTTPAQYSPAVFTCAGTCQGSTCV